MQGAQIELTDIQQFYKNETVLLTGGTGFIGKLLLEKILRALPIKKVFLLIRSKKNAEPATRLQTIFASPIFQVLKRSHPDVFSKVEAVHGDCGLPMLGMSQQNVERLQEEVSVIFHCAANVRFEEPIKSATFLNVRATKDLIYIARKLKKIKAFVYVGTAYSNSNRKEIKEQVYPAKISAENLIGACEALDEATLASINPTLIADWPNNYTFTKQVAEDYISREAQDIPICICRPSVVMATAEEPLAAFFDSPYSLGAFSVVNALGICRISYFKRGVVDLIPADYLVNECIAAGWHTAGNFKNPRTEIPVYHMCSSPENPMQLEDIFWYGHCATQIIPLSKSLMYPLFFFTTCKPNYLLWRFILHTLLAFFVDMFVQLKGQTPKLGAAMKKLHRVQDSYEYFTTHSFYFHIENRHKMLKKMSFKDREMFNFNIKELNWHDYFVQQMRGLRIYIAKDPISTVPAAIKRNKRLRNIFVLSFIAITILAYGLGKILLFRLLPWVLAGAAYFLRMMVC
ncbi:fatty acyl-CoA reductase wat [Dendroctonus ponderosae]|uniref:fatty acyl-CoA reductase wat n=1 Tax=Dendroctonus ponderosae TaxID=77166 RepID=UPI0020365F58|nr:fatty acyl-CoA reductase wat [Dendroctonus ponderosae]KAH1018238.1 hypothetical protein HUJ05_006047 [Dendroctonus ponderosae]